MAPETSAQTTTPLPATVCDFELLVRQDTAGNQIRLSYQLKTQTPLLPPSHQSFTVVSLDGDPFAFFKTLFRDVEKLPRRDANTKRIAEERLGGIGVALFDRLLPAELCHKLWALHDLVQNRGATTPTLHLISNEAWIPWELLKLYNPDDTGSDGLFLVQAFALTRWLQDAPGCLALPLSNVALVVPDDSRLKTAGEERDRMLALASGGRQVTRIPARLLELVDAMAAGGYDGWHFTGHGLAAGDNPFLWALRLENEETLRATDLYDRARNMGTTRPAVFLNACHSGLGAFALTGIGGLATAFVEAGAGAFIGSHWMIADAPAAEFAAAFYEHFLMGLPISEAARGARIKIKERYPGDPTWLAYTVFAHPLAVCTSAAPSETPAEPGSPAAVAAPLAAREEDGEPVPPAASEPLPDGTTERSSDGRQASGKRLGGASEERMYDVFFSYNNKDREIVVEIAAKLKERGIRVWLDVRDLRPGTDWQEELEKVIGEIRAAAVFVGPGDMGPWQQAEMRAFLSEAAARKIPIIPILLPGLGGKPELPMFLRRFTWVELGGPGITDQDTERLIWGIRGAKPEDKPTERIARKPGRGRSRRAGILGLVALLLILAAIAWQISRRDRATVEQPPAEPPLVVTPAVELPRSSAAVLTFANRSAAPNLDWLKTAMAEVLSAKLGIDGAVRVIERDVVVKAEISLDFNERDSFSREDLSRLGRLAATDFVVTGSFTADGGPTAIRLQLNLYDARDGNRVAHTEEIAAEGSWLELVHRGSGIFPNQPGLRQALGARPLTAKQVEQLKSWFPSQIEPARLYAEGLSRSNGFDLPGARDAYLRAIAIEPHPLIYAALAKALYHLGWRQPAEDAIAEALKLGKDFSGQRQMELALLAARIRHDRDQVLTQSDSWFRSYFPDDLNYGLLHVEIQADLGDPNQALLVLDELRNLPAATDHPRLSRIASQIYVLRGQYDQALASAERSLEQARALGAVWEEALSQLALAAIAIEIEEQTNAVSYLSEARRGFQGLRDYHNEGQCIELSARLYENDDLAMAEVLLRDALALYERTGDQREQVRALFALSGVKMAQGDAGRAGELADRAKELSAGLWFGFDDGYYPATKGYYEHLAGRLRSARLQYSAAAEIFSRSDERDFYGVMLTNQGEIEYMLGNFDLAEELHRRALEIHEADDAMSSSAYDLFRLGRLYAAAGDYVAARDRYERALSLQENLGEDVYAAETRLALAELDLGLGSFDASVAAAAKSEEMLRRADEINLRVRADAILTQGFLAQGRNEQARGALGRAQELAANVTDFRSRYALEIATARLNAADGNVEPALEALRNLATAASSAEHLLCEFEILLAIGEIELDAGRTADGRERLAALASRAASRGVSQFERRARAALGDE